MELSVLAQLSLLRIRQYSNVLMVRDSQPNVYDLMRSNGALVNLADRLSKEQRRGWRGVPLQSPDASPTVLLIIDEGTLRQKHWRGLQPEKLGRFGVYTVWRVERTRLNDRAAELMADGVDADWQKPRPERF